MLLWLQRLHVRLAEHRVGANYVSQDIVTAASMVVLPARGASADRRTARNGKHLALIAPAPVLLAVLGKGATTSHREDIVTAARVIVHPARGTFARRRAARE